MAEKSETGREEVILQRGTISQRRQTTSSWKVLENREKLPFTAPPDPRAELSESNSHTPTKTHTHVHRHGTIIPHPQSISAAETHPSSLMLMGGVFGVAGVGGARGHFGKGSWGATSEQREVRI